MLMMSSFFSQMCGSEHDPSLKVITVVFCKTRAVVIHHLIDFLKLGRMNGTYEIWQTTNFELNSFDNLVLNYSHLLSFVHFCQK